MNEWRRFSDWSDRLVASAVDNLAALERIHFKPISFQLTKEATPVKASIGRIVIVKGGRAVSNGADRAPAIITRVWNPDTDTRNEPVMVNTIAFCDCATPQLITSVKLFDTEADAEAGRGGASEVAFWPERV